MRQFILAGNVAYPTQATPDKLTAGSVGFFYNKDGQFTVDADGTGITREGMLILARSAEDGGNVVIPVFKQNFRYTKGAYQAATTFTATIEIPAPTKIGEYSIIIAKKGLLFNERNKWTASVYVKDVTMTADDLAEELVKHINYNTASHECTAEADSASITITATKKGKDYTVLGADLLMGVEVDITSGTPAYGDAKYVTDLANKAASEAGFNDTYQEANVYMYPNYPLNPLKSADAEDTGFTIFTLKFTEPRNTKPLDDVVNQIIQVAFPTGAAGITTFETVCKALAGVK